MIENYTELDIKRLVKASWNYKKDDDERKEKLKANIKRNGQIENLIVRPLDTGFYEVVNGNHRYDAMVELGFETVVCYDLGTISDQKAMRIAVETNETKFDTDHMRLAETIKEILTEFEAPDLAETMPYSEKDIENYGKLLDFDWEQFNKPPDIEYKDGRFIITIESDSLDKANIWMQDKGLDYTIKEGQNSIKIKI